MPFAVGDGVVADVCEAMAAVWDELPTGVEIGMIAADTLFAMAAVGGDEGEEGDGLGVTTFGVWVPVAVQRLERLSAAWAPGAWLS